MGVFRFQAPAVIYFDVTADSEEEAVKLANMVRHQNIDDGFNISLFFRGLPARADAYAYFQELNEDSSRVALLTAKNIVDTTEAGE